MSNTTFQTAITAHADFDAVAFWASLMVEWDELPDVFLDLGDVARSDFFIEMASNAAWMAASLISDDLVAT
jgi:hypothetical protein